MKQPMSINHWLALMTALLSALTFDVSAKGIKGNLEAEELRFVNQTVMPALIAAGICTTVQGDCQKDLVFCSSHDSLACDIYGLADEKKIREIAVAALQSEVRISSFTFWRSKFHRKAALEKPLFRFIDRTGGIKKP